MTGMCAFHTFTIILAIRSDRLGEDTRFCELLHLTLKDFGRPHDMHNSHILALIEQRMCTDDRKYWMRQ